MKSAWLLHLFSNKATTTTCKKYTLVSWHRRRPAQLVFEQNIGTINDAQYIQYHVDEIYLLP